MKYYIISEEQLSNWLSGLDERVKASVENIRAAAKPSKSTFWFEGYLRASDQARDDLFSLRLKEIPRSTNLVN